MDPRAAYTTTATANKRQKQDKATTPTLRELKPLTPLPPSHHKVAVIRNGQAQNGRKVPGKAGPGPADASQQEIAAKQKQHSQASGKQAVGAPPNADPGRSKAANQRKKARQKSKRLATQARGGTELPPAGGKVTGSGPVGGQKEIGKAGVGPLMGESAEGGKKRREGRPRGGSVKAVGVPDATQTKLQQPQLGEHL